jgi:hypothetical protein
MFKRRKSPTEKFFNAIAESIQTEPEQWYIETDCGPPFFWRRRLFYKKAPEMVFEFDTNDGEVTVKKPEEIRPTNDHEHQARRRLKEIAKKQFIDAPNQNAAQAMLNMFLGEEYTILPLPQKMTADLHTKLCGMKNGTLVTNDNVWFTSKKDAAFFRLCCEEFDKKK